MSYVDGFMAPVPAANRDEYLKHCKDAAAVFKDHGATRVVETWADDVPEGKITPMPFDAQRMICGGFNVILDV